MIKYYDATWITASWAGGALGENPTDYRAIEATEWNGLLCPAEHLRFDYLGHMLNFINKCDITVTYALCSPKGTLEGPYVCSTDPLNTDPGNLLIRVVNPGDLGDYVNTSPNLSVNFFFCSDQDQLVTGPIRCMGVR